ncbi:MAG TPA: hypothetical protein VG942_10435 [Hyphomonadaceae bacterium]|nr:hypothetical protein [Hyphomonadaceae bacterium]
MKQHVSAVFMALGIGFGAGGAGAQVIPQYNEIKQCQNMQLTPADRVAACDKELAALPESTRDYGEVRGIGMFYRSDAKSNTPDLDGAIKDADEARKLVPEERHIMAAQCWARAVANKELKTAKQNCDDSLALNPDDPSVMDSAGMVALRQGRWEDAAKMYAKAYSYDHSMVGSLYGAALAAYAQGKTESGDTILKTVQEKKPQVIDDFTGWGLTVDGMKAKAKAVPAKPASKPASKPAAPKPN